MEGPKRRSSRSLRAGNNPPVNDPEDNHEIENRRLTYRAMPVKMDENGRPSTIDDATRSVEVVGATENPAMVWDWERWAVVQEVLLMSGCRLPESRQVVGFDTHQYRGGTVGVIGSYRDMTARKKELTGRFYFTSLQEGESPWVKLREGHLTDFSVGYDVLEYEWIPEGATAAIQGKKYKGPLKVTTVWTPRELSICPVGADELAKARGAILNNKPKQEVRKMTPEVRAILIARGMPATATDEEAMVYLARMTQPVETAVQQPQLPAAVETQEAVRQAQERAAQEETARVQEIMAMCRAHGLSDEFRDKLIAGKTPMSEIHREGNAEIKRIEAERAKTQPPGSPEDGIIFRSPIIVGADEHDKFRDAARDAILIKGNVRMGDANPAPGADELTGLTMLEMARMCLSMSGQSIRGSKMEMVGRAMMTADLPYILAAAANKSLAAGFDIAEETWRVWCGIGSVPDFKTLNLVRASETADLDEVPENSEYKYGKITESREQVAVVTYGKMFAITRQAIVNDDLGAITDIPKKHGEAASRKIGDLPYAVLTANAAMGDGIVLFHASHSNLGTSGVVGEVTIGELIKLMKLQKDLQGLSRLNLQMKYFIAPAAIEGAAEIFFNSNQFTGADVTTTRNNPYAGTRFTRVYEPRLDASSSAIYYGAGPKGKTVNVFFLDGVETPYLESRDGWSVDGVEYKVRIDAAAKAVDWRGLVRNAGV